MRLLLVLVSLLVLCVFGYYNHQHRNGYVSLPTNRISDVLNPDIFEFFSLSPRTVSYSKDINGYQAITVIKGPIIDGDNNEYYDVYFPNHYDFNYGSHIVHHWQTHLPVGTKPSYDTNSPQIFLNGRRTDPYNYVQEKYWTDSEDRLSLWTVALTEHSVNIDWCVDYSKTHDGFGYITVFGLQHSDTSCELFKTPGIFGNVPKSLSQSTDILGRLQYPLITEHIRHPDSYIFTESAQKGPCKLQIVRVYRLHFAKCMLDISTDPPVQSCS